MKVLKNPEHRNIVVRALALSKISWAEHILAETSAEVREGLTSMRL